MNYSTAIFLISDEVRAVNVTYEEAKEGQTIQVYTYKTFDPNIAVGDFVTVPTDTRHHMTVCKVVEVDIDVDLDTTIDMKWIIGKVDRANFEQIAEQEAQAIAKIKSAEKRKRRDELREALMEDAGSELKALPIYKRQFSRGSDPQE